MRILLISLLTALCLYAGHFDQDAIATHAKLAGEARQRGDFTTAASEWQAVIGLAPQMAEAHSNLGMMRHFAGQYPKAIAAFQQALALNPKLVAPHLFLGIDYYLISHPRDAIPELRSALALDPGNPLARKWLGMSYFQAGDFAESAIALSAALQADPNDLDLLFFQSRVYSKLLFHSYERVKSLAPKSAYLDSFRADVDLKPGPDPEIIRLAGLLSSGDAGKSLSGLLALTRNKPDAAENWYWLAKAAGSLALKSMDLFLARSPESYRTHQLKGEYARATGNDDTAASEYREALALNPNAVQIHLELGNIFIARHDRPRAIAEYQAELRVDPYSLAALQRIGVAYADMHQPDRAQEYLARALQIAPEDYDALLTLGKVQYERGDYPGAVQHYLAALKRRQSPDSAVLFRISKAYRSLGNEAEATIWMDRFRQQLAAEHQKTQHDFAPR